MQHGVSGIQYPDSYQQPFDPRYGRGYGAPTPPQQPQQPNLFVPPQTTQVVQTPQVCHHIILHLIKIIGCLIFYTFSLIAFLNLIIYFL